MMTEEIKNLSATFNAYREYNLNKQFTASDIAKIFKEIGLPISSNFRVIAVKNGLIFKYGITFGSYYTFPKDPVYMGNIESAIKEFRSYNKQRYNGSKPKSVEIIESESLEQNAIELLKSLGYKIYKPRFEEI